MNELMPAAGESAILGPFAAAVRISRCETLLFISGQVGVDGAGEIVGDSMLTQARQTFTNLLAVVRASGLETTDIVKLVYYVVDMSRWGEVAQARQEALGSHKPASTTVEVSRLFDTRYLIEIEAVACR